MSKIISHIFLQADLEQHNNFEITVNVYKVDTSAFKENKTMTAEIYHSDYASVIPSEIFDRVIIMMPWYSFTVCDSLSGENSPCIEASLYSVFLVYLFFSLNKTLW